MTQQQQSITLLQEQFDGMMKAAGANLVIGCTQYNDMRRAFFAGAAAFYGLEMSMLDQGDEATEMDVSVLKALHRELVAFNEAVKRGEK